MAGLITAFMRRNGDRGLPGGDREILDRGYGFHRTGARWLPDRWMGMPGGAPGGGGGGGLADGALVSSWPDSSGNGFTATQTGTKRPIFKTNIINGKPVVRFTTAGQSGMDLTAIGLAAASTFFMVMKPASPSSSGIISLAGDAYHGTGTVWSDGVMYSNCGFYSTTCTLTGVDRTLFHVYSIANVTGAICQYRVDGTAFPNGGAGPIADTYKHIGYVALATPQYSDGDIAEIIFYTGALATLLPAPGVEPRAGEPRAAGDRANIEAYLGAKYGIPVTSGGTPVDPSTVAGLYTWWKADSL
jgi:hypothetical protein